MKVGYLVRHKPELASYRLRVQLPAPHLGCDYVIGDVGRPTFFYKLGHPELAASLGEPIVFDVVNDHFAAYPTVPAMVRLAKVVTAGSEEMAKTIEFYTGRKAIVIDDPYENDEAAPSCEGHDALWFGHLVNIASLEREFRKLQNQNLVICSNIASQQRGHIRTVEWSRESEERCLRECAVVLLTGGNKGASTNRVVKALRAGRFVVMPEACPLSWRQFREFCWIGDVRKGLNWAFQNRADACALVRAGQDYVRERFSPQTIGAQWGAAFKEAA